MRVIAGRFGGRTIVAPPGAATRPTSDRVREALFSILGDLRDAAVLDLYAGTGALGIEALSRGAASATFVENGRAALRALRRNLDELGIESAQVLAIPVERAVSNMSWGDAAFDVVFVDPPYALVRGGRAPTFLAGTESRSLAPSVRPAGRVVLEHASAEPSPPLGGLELVDTRTYGDTALSFYLR